MTINLNSPWPYLVTALFISLMGLYAWRQPRRPGTRYFSWMVIVWLVWALGAALSTVVHSWELRYAMWAVQAVCPLVAAPVQLMFTLEYTGQEKWLSWRVFLLLTIPAFILSLALLVLPSRFLATAETHTGFEVIQGTQLVKWGSFAYVALIMLLVISLLLVRIPRSPAFRAPIIWIMVGQIIPVIGYAAVDPQHLTVPPVQVTILFTNFTVLAYSVALYYHILQVVPVAQDLIISHLPYGLLVLDAEDHLVDFNAEAQNLPQLPGKLVLRQPAAKALGDWWGRLSPLIGSQPVTQEVVLRASTDNQYYQVYSLPLIQASGWRMGQAFALQDVTQERRLQQKQSQLLWAQASLQEREQLANELHDGISQGLAFLGMQAQTAQIFMQQGETLAAQNSLVRLVEAAGEIQEDTRRMIGDLLAVSLPAETFCETLRQVLERFTEQTRLAVHMELDGKVCSLDETFHPSIQLPPSVAVQLIRITQEALANVSKHAQQAHLVSIDLKTLDGQILLAIADDGIGFDPQAQPSAGKHFGLQVMQQRAARISGLLTVSSVPGEGTRVEVRAPLAIPSGE